MCTFDETFVVVTTNTVNLPQVDIFKTRPDAQKFLRKSAVSIYNDIRKLRNNEVTLEEINDCYHRIVEKTEWGDDVTELCLVGFVYNHN